MKRSFSMLAMVLIACSGSPILQAQGDYAYMSGLGMESCGDFVLAMEQNTPHRMLQRADGVMFHTKSAAYREWVQGFLAAYSAWMGAEESHLTADITGIMVWLREYCTKNPTMVFGSAVGAYARREY